MQVGNRSLLDQKTTFRNVDHQRRVVEIAASSPLNERRDRLEHLAADAHDMRGGDQRDPVEIHHSDPVDISLKLESGSRWDPLCVSVSDGGGGRI